MEGGNQLALKSVAEDLNLRQLRNKSSMWPEWYSNLGLLDYESDTLTTWPSMLTP